VYRRHSILLFLMVPVLMAVGIGSLMIDRQALTELFDEPAPWEPDPPVEAAVPPPVVGKMVGAQDGIPRHLELPHDEPVYCVAFSGDGKVLATGGGAGGLWEVGSGKRITRLRIGDGGAIRSLAFHPTKRSFVGAFHWCVCSWDADTGRMEGYVGEHGCKVLSVAVSADAKTVAAGDENGSIKLWDLETCKLGRESLGSVSGGYHGAPYQFSSDNWGGQ